MSKIRNNKTAIKNQQDLTNNITSSIDEYLKENSEKTNMVSIGNSFCEWILYNIFELREDEVNDAVEISGKFDNGIDAVFEYNSEICILQSKYSTSHSIDSMVRFIADCQRVATELPYSERDYVLEMCKKVRQANQNNETINCYYITNNDISEHENIQKKSALKNVKEEYKNLKYFFYDFENIHEAIEIKKGMLPKNFRDKKIKLPIQSNFESFGTLVTMVKVNHFAEFVNEGGNTLFHSNIRNFLKGTKINQGIKKTLKEELNNFWYYNNGVTIVCDDYAFVRGLVNITAPQIVNGCQTAKTLAGYFKNMTSSEINELEQEGYILIKIIKTKKSADENLKKELRDKITRYTNSQNAVKGLDFYALDTFQRTLKISFKQYGYYYEIQRGSFITEPPSIQKSYKGNDQYNYLLEAVKNSKKFVLPAKEIIQSFTAAIKQMPNVAYGRANELTPLGSQWEKIINDDTKKLPLEHFLFPFLVLKFAKEELNYKAGPNDFRKNAAFLFVSTYYLFLLRLYNQIKHLEIESPTDISIEFFTRLFNNRDLNIELLKINHKILRSYFRDTLIKNEVGDNLRGFLQNKVHKPKNWEILEFKVDQILEDIEFEDVYKDIIEVINSVS
ncbi:AIPR family protein [Bacillus sp. V2I10]|uniref:AIPR family protein n=1 Tax=Bacillus sp. V2I10 TaxID=3042276 RepID=UPI00278409EF|nr:AIPR family protein [Bacillus sp. V2I10]MDQ0861602.1 hypothetical protein [Bacillus sp. V2I10]